MQVDPGVENLAKVEHIVVLMLENRSFDHMLGYLSLEAGRTDIDGLTGTMANDAGGQTYGVTHLTAPTIPNPHWDPDHSSAATDMQVNGGKMDGFAASFAQTLAARNIPNPDPGMVMGYYNAADLPVYDHLAEQFCVCDRWHSSVPGATWPNRLYAVAGSAAGSRDDNVKPFPVYGRPLPIYDKHSFVRHLEAVDVDWRWYTYDVGTLRCVDGAFRLGNHERFAYVDRSKLPLDVMLEEELLLDEDSASFIEDAQRGRLAPVSWIDPNFKDLNVAHVQSNDDHPPSDIGAGQELVMLVYNAVASGPLWDKTLLLVVYDEHGGFHDHVPPPEAIDDDPAKFGRYGVRVPALAVSSWIPPRSVASTLFDHTSIIKTILTRFAPAELQRRSGISELLHWLEEGHPGYMGKRVASAEHLGGLLSNQAPRPAPDRSDLVSWLTARHTKRTEKLVSDPVAFPAEARLFTDLQRSTLAAARYLHDQGHPPGQP
jgi:phospholipase C